MANPEVTRLAQSYMSADAQVRSRVTTFIATVWDNLGSYRDADIERFVRAVVPVVLGGQRQVAALTDAYLASIASQTLGGAPRVVGLKPAQMSGEALRGVPPAEVYRRPGVDVWTALFKGKSLVDAVKAGRLRALSLASTDLQLAKTHTARAVFSKDPRVVGHRRTLSGSEDCGMCVVASTQRYHKENLQPIHPGCDCGVEPIYGDRDPGQVIDEDTLAQAHDAIAERFGVSSADARTALDYRKVLLVREHGELGPVLTVKGQNFTGPSDI